MQACEFVLASKNRRPAFAPPSPMSSSSQQHTSTPTSVRTTTSHDRRMEEPEPRPRRRLDPKAASMAGFLAPHANSSSHGHGHGRGNAGGGGGGWKARLKERCLNRVRQERDRLVQEMRGLASPPPPGAAPAASAAGAARPFLPSPPPVIAGVGAAVGTPQQEGQQQSRRASTPSSLSGAALSILQHEIRESRREQQQQQGEGMVVAEEEGDEEALLSVEEQVELMRCIEEVLAQEMAWAEESAAGEYSQVCVYLCVSRMYVVVVAAVILTTHISFDSWSTRRWKGRWRSCMTTRRCPLVRSCSPVCGHHV